MKNIAAVMIMLTLPGCGFTPWVTPEEAKEIADKQALERVQELADAIAKTGTDVSEYRPTAAYRAPQGPAGIDWGEILVLGITALTGGAGAIGYRALDHRRRRNATQTKK